jgi:hypothetical protein
MDIPTDSYAAAVDVAAGRRRLISSVTSRAYS